MRLSTRCSTAALLLIAAASAASAQTYWSYGDMARARGAITARPMMAGHNMAAAEIRLRPWLQLRPASPEQVSLALLEALAYFRL